jgi:hypothetical protein
MATPDDPGESKGASRSDEQGAKKEPRSKGGPIEQLIFTLRTATGEVVRIERVDATGKRGDVPRDETVGLVGKRDLEEIETVLDEAFEAGIAGILDPGDDDEEPETSDEKKLHKFLLRLIIGRAIRRRLCDRIMLRLIVARTLSRDAETGLTRKT